MSITKCLITAAGLITCAYSLNAQTPSPTATPDEKYKVTSSIEFGVRSLDVNGDHDKFRSDLNYRPGFRIFDSSVLVENNGKGPRRFDTALFTASGWGGDPTSMFRANIDKTATYKFDANVRRVKYFNNLKNHVLTFSQPVSTGSQRRYDTAHNFADFDLTVFPTRPFRMRFGYSVNDTRGPGTDTIRFSGDEYQVNSRIRNRSHDFRTGVEGEFHGFNLGLNYGYRKFTDDTQFFVDTFNPGNNPAANTSFLNRMTRGFDVDGSTHYVHSYFQRTFARRFDLTGRFIYSNSNSIFQETDFLNGRASSTGNFILSDEISVPGTAKRTQSRGDLGFTWRATDKFRVSNLFTFDQFNTGGALTFFELVRATNAGGTPIANAVTRSSAWRATSYRRFANLIEADYQASPRFGFNAGLRVTTREVTIAIYDVNLVTGAVQRSGSEEHQNSTVSFIAGTRIKPVKHWRIYADLEHGATDNVFTRLSNNDFTNFRVRSIASVGDVSLNTSFILRNNSNPGTSAPITSAGGFPPTETIADTRSRIFSASVDWQPRIDFSLSSGYTYSHQTSRTDIIVPVGTPLFPSTRFLLGLSEYYLRDNYFFFDVNARPHKRISFFASYRINDDGGQGDRVQSRAQDVVSSYPMRLQMPEVRAAIRLTRNIDWNLGYQYYSYRERSFTNIMTPFATPAQIIPAQNYTAHMPFTSLRIYFGRVAGER